MKINAVLVYVTIYTKERDKLELTFDEWLILDFDAITLHSEDDIPAIDYSTGYKQWYRNGKLHRVNGNPAVYNSYGEESYYYIDDVDYSYEDYKAIIEEVNNMHEALRLTDPREWVREL